MLDTWNDVARKLNTMAEDFPEDKYDFKPTPAQRSFAEQLLHAAGANYFFTNLANGQKPPSEEEPKRSTFKNKAEIVAYVKKAMDDGAAAIKSKGDKGMNDTVVDPFANQQVRIIDLLRVHRAHGRALRTTGGVLPGRGIGPAGVASEEVIGVSESPKSRDRMKPPRLFTCTPCMFDSWEVKVLFTT